MVIYLSLDNVCALLSSVLIIGLYLKNWTVARRNAYLFSAKNLDKLRRYQAAER